MWGSVAGLRSMAVDSSHLQTADKSSQQVEAGSELALRQESRSAETAASAVALTCVPNKGAFRPWLCSLVHHADRPDLCILHRSATKVAAVQYLLYTSLLKVRLCRAHLIGTAPAVNHCLHR